MARRTLELLITGKGTPTLKPNPQPTYPVGTYAGSYTAQASAPLGSYANGYPNLKR